MLLERTEDRDGYVVLSKEKAEKMKIWDEVEKAFETGEPIIGRVIDRIKGGLTVDIGVPAFLPGSQVDVRPVRNLETLIGQELRMRVIKVNKKRGNIVLSRKALLEDENAEKKKKTLETLEEGKILTRRRQEHHRLRRLHRPRRHRRPAAHHRHVLGPHQPPVREVPDRRRARRRSCSSSTARPSASRSASSSCRPIPWDDARRSSTRRQSRIRGKVVSLTDYGAFVELEEGVEGLIHVSEMSWTKRVKHPSKMLNVGDRVECVVLDVDQESAADLARPQADRDQPVGR